jgi:hypothetical protein
LKAAGGCEVKVAAGGIAAAIDDWMDFIFSSGAW